MPSVWAISDLHLRGASLSAGLTLGWRDHVAKVERHWRATVAPEDIVLIPGDFSHARTHRELQPDLVWLEGLPGMKCLAPGNHDVWWNRLDAVRRLLRKSQRAVDGDALAMGPIIVAGARSAAVPAEDAANAPEREAFTRSLERLDRALAHATSQQGSGQPIYLLWHHCPFDDHGQATEVTRRLEQAGVSVCVYGHLHTQAQWMRAPQGIIRGVRYACVAADALGFHPLRVGVFELA